MMHHVTCKQNVGLVSQSDHLNATVEAFASRDASAPSSRKSVPSSVHNASQRALRADYRPDAASSPATRHIPKSNSLETEQASPVTIR